MSFDTTSTSSESPATSPFSDSESLPKNCQVCGQKAHGLHFGAVTCRACAAFFRRVAAGASFVVKCRNGSGTCKVVQNGRSCCKKCRLKRCKAIGMDIQNFQYDRDLLSTTQKLPPSLSNFLGRPQFIILCDPETASSSQQSQNLINVSDLLEKASRILEKPKVPWASEENRLQSLAFALNLDRGTSEDVPLTSVRRIGLLETMSFWEHDFLQVATWLSHFDEFQSLEKHVKMKLLKTIWPIWSRLEKLGRSCRNRLPRQTVCLANDCVLDLEEMELDISWMTRFSLEQVAYYIEGVGDWSIFSILSPISDLNPTDMELSYMLAQLSFQYAGAQLQGVYLEIAESFQQLLANDLHDYYARILETSRYSDRVAKMMKVNNMVREFYWKKKEKLAIARTFEVFNVRFSEEDMFCDIY